MVLHRTVVVLIVMIASFSWSQASPLEARPDQRSSEIDFDTLQAELSESKKYLEILSKQLMSLTLKNEDQVLKHLGEEPDGAWQYRQLHLWRQEQLLEANLETCQYILDFLRKASKSTTASYRHGLNLMLQHLQQGIRAIAERIKEFQTQMLE